MASSSSYSIFVFSLIKDGILSLFFCYAMVESSRLFLATKGNKTSQLGPLTASMLLSLPIIVLHAYYMELQLYVLRAEVVLNAIAIFFVGVEFIVSFFVVFSFLAASRKF